MEKQSYPCENCKFRAHYDKNPKSVLGLNDSSRLSTFTVTQNDRKLFYKKALRLN